MKGIQSISIIGTSNVAFHLGNSFFDQGITISSVFGRNQRGAEAFANQWKSKAVDHISELETDLILVCVWYFGNLSSGYFSLILSINKSRSS